MMTRLQHSSLRAGKPGTLPLTLAVMAALCVLSAAGDGFAAPSRAAAKKPAFDPRDLSGIWENPPDVRRSFDQTVANFRDQKPPLNPTWMEEWRLTRRRADAGMKVWDAIAACLPPGMPRTMNASYPFQILDTPGQMTLIAEYFNELRFIYMDGRGHPEPEKLDPTFSGHSVAHWEGDSLVIDTVGLRHETVIDVAMVPHSDQLHIVERVRRVGPDTLEWTITLEDPVVFERPWTSTKRFVRSPPGSTIREYVCAENKDQDPYTPSPDDAKYEVPDPRLDTLP